MRIESTTYTKYYAVCDCCGAHGPESTVKNNARLDALCKDWIIYSETTLCTLCTAERVNRVLDTLRKD